MNRSTRVLLLGLVVVAVVPLASAQAEPAATVLQLELFATIHAAGVDVTLQGDNGDDDRVTLRYRKTGDGSWIEGHRLLRVAPGHHIGSLFYLEPETSYEVEVTVSDPSGDTQVEKGSVTTRRDTPPDPTGLVLHVSATNGSDQNNGIDAPLATIQAALDKAQPGDRVVVGPGTYRESLEFPRSGTESAPIGLIGEPGAIIDGSDLALASNPSWTLLHDDIYWTPFSGTTTYLAVDDARIYDYQSLADLENETGGQSGQSGVLKGGFFVDAGAKRLYLRLPDGSSPSGKTVYAGVRSVAILVDGQSHLVIDGFEIRYFGGPYAVGIDLRGASNVWVRNNVIHHVIAGIRSRKGASMNVIEHNRLRDTSIYDWPWSSVKAHTGEASGITLSGGRGDIARYNTIEGFFNGIYTGEFDTTDLGIARDIDVYGNLLRRIGDDGLEPEGACVNQRFFENTIVSVFNAVSLAPIETGPTWLIRTVINGYREHALKVNNAPTGPMLVYHTTALPGDNPDAQAIAPSVPFANLILRNNIWVGHRYVIEYTETSLLGAVDFDYDDLYSDNLDGTQRFVKWLDVRYADLASLQDGTGLELNGFAVKPEFESPETGDLTLKAGHPLIDKGVPLPGINHVGLQNAPDVGAFERGGLRPGFDSPGPTPTGPDATDPGSDVTAPGADTTSPGSDTSGAGDANGTGDGSGVQSSGGGCSLAGAAHRGPDTPLWPMLALLGVLSIWRRRRRSPR